MLMVLLIELPIFVVVVAPNYHEWGNWSECSHLCGDGTMTRTRTYDYPLISGDFPEDKGTGNCNIRKCPGKFDF